MKKLDKAPPVAKTDSDNAERLILSARDTRLWVDLLDNPPEANARLIAVAKALQAGK